LRAKERSLGVEIFFEDAISLTKKFETDQTKSSVGIDPERAIFRCPFFWRNLAKSGKKRHFVAI
jgi:hypothetical protein